MQINLDEGLVGEIKTHGAEQFPKEACGFVVAVGKKYQVVTCKNESESPTENFILGAESYVHASKIGKIVGVWHTHPNAPSKPSVADLQMCELTELPWFIVGVYRRESGEFLFDDLHYIEPSGFELDYLQRPYVFGVLDCYSLAQDFYRREYGIRLGRDYPHIEDWWKKGYNFFQDNFEKEGFVEVFDDPKRGDIYLLQVQSDVQNHVAIHLGNDTILHHLQKRLSRRDVFSGPWARCAGQHLRHKDLTNDATH